jgi:hypothetical protein
MDLKEMAKRIENFTRARTVVIGGKTYLPVNESTLRHLMLELALPKEEYEKTGSMGRKRLPILNRPSCIAMSITRLANTPGFSSTMQRKNFPVLNMYNN